ncbi:General stress protein CTC [Sedimentisphaera cyanobacteriorum]|uniref:Large ribosomal subunit protein bL25 n=1 Tax=Sedimentisphaera cyanobacteriorum TaxID=1940790 RepID=A0A1Q2HMY7_9BACT|nr:50S ribosomal protein L25 [Sedimentisphaera cyanobacteriorum]AQQ08625.1 General stress protein CTC [Sedimentisphaera cyanobacteriorum]
MTETFSLKAELRETGTKSAVKLRENGRTPAVIYGHKQEPVAVSIETSDLLKAMHSGNRLFDLEFDGKSETLLLKDMQYDHYQRDVIHVDLMRVDMDEKASVTVPVVLKGTAKGIAEGGMVDVHLDHIDVECPVVSIPEYFEVLIKDLGLNDYITVGNIELPRGASLITDSESVVVNCHEVTVAPEPEEGEELEEEAVEPEVITEKKPEDEEEQK